MSTFNIGNLTFSQQKRTQQQQLQELYSYYDFKQQPKQKPQQCHNQLPQNDQQYLNEGCEYVQESFYDHNLNFQQYDENDSEKKEKPSHSHNASQGISNSFTIQYRHQEHQALYNSQPTAVNRFQHARSPSNKQLSANSSKQSYNSRSVHALVSAEKNKKKIKKAPSKATSQRSLSSQVSTRNKLIMENKEKKKNGDKTIEAIFFNPLASLPFEAIDADGFQKIYKISHSQMFAKINELQKKIAILGEKSFFKDKQNEQNLDEIFKTMGFKTSSKMGKAKSFREFKAIYKYLNMDNPEGSASKKTNIGQGAKLIDNAYLSQFKELMGYKENEEEKEQSSNKSLFGYGFGKLERKH